MMRDSKKTKGTYDGVELAMKESHQSIGIVTPVVSRVSSLFLSNLVSVVYSISKGEMHVIAGNANPEDYENACLHSVRYKKVTNAFTRIANYIYLQTKISYKLVRLTSKVDLWIFFLEGEALLLPMLCAKSLKKKVVLALGSSIEKKGEFRKDSLYKLMSCLKRINFALSDKIILYSENLIKEWDLEKYKNKISIAHHHFFDFDKFKIKKKFDTRKNLVGYIGRLSEEKGVLNFVKAIPKVLEKENKIKFLVGGDGQLRDKIKEYLDVASLNDKVKLTGWISDEEFLTYLNELKLFVLPSYTEGLPYTLLEAMACGTPVLATPVGAIPDVIKDGETGFIMENNSPECIAKNIVMALSHPNINEITKNARALIEEKYNYQAAVDGYRIILSSTF
jgi:glycosyltransferase involved in cell wall biosynthesis